MRRYGGFWIAGLVLSGLACNLSIHMPLTSDSAVSARTEPGPQVAPSNTRAHPSPTSNPVSSPEQSICADQSAAVVLLVDPVLAAGVRANLDRFEADLCADGYGVIERALDFQSPPQARAYLADLYARTGQALEGAIFIGAVPLAYQAVQAKSSNPENQPAAQEVISFQYYADLDGEFSAASGYQSAGRHVHSFDLHTGGTDWEIWIGVLPLYRGELSQTVDALNRYFEKNHRYRTGGYSIPVGFLQINEHFNAKTAEEAASLLTGMRAGLYAWTPLSNAPGAKLYFNAPGVSFRDGYADLSAGAADITVTETHGDHTTSGMINIGWVESRPVRTVLYWTDGCSVGNLAYPDNFLTSVVYSPTSEVLMAKGSTNDSGGLGTNAEGFYGHNIAVRLAAGSSIGRAILGHVNVPLIYPWADSREFHFSMLLLIGDPTLRLRDGA